MKIDLGIVGLVKSEFIIIQICGGDWWDKTCKTFSEII